MIYFKAINSIFNIRNFRLFQERHGINILSKDDFEVIEGLFEKLFSDLENGNIVCKGGFTVETALEQLFSDWFYVHYIVMSDGDTIDT